MYTWHIMWHCCYEELKKEGKEKRDYLVVFYIPAVASLRIIRLLSIRHVWLICIYALICVQYNMHG